MDADAVDIRANAKFRDESIKEFIHETKVLQKLAGAPNVNQIFDVMEVEAQLWIISEYVPGGSVKTLVCFWTSNRLSKPITILFRCRISSKMLIDDRCKALGGIWMNPTFWSLLVR